VPSHDPHSAATIWIVTIENGRPYLAYPERYCQMNAVSALAPCSILSLPFSVLKSPRFFDSHVLLYLHLDEFVHIFLLMSHKMSINTSQVDSDGPPYFWSSNRRDLRHSSNQTSSTNVSPFSLPPHPKRHKSRYTNPSFHVRSRSDQPVRSRQISVVPVAEQAPTTLQKSAPASFASSKVSITSLIRKIPTITHSSCTPDPVQDGPPKSKPSRPGIDWSRTHSGGIWFVRPTSGNKRELQQSSDSPKHTSYFSRSGRDVVTPPKPLRPPFARSDASLGSGYRHEVKLETSFTASIEQRPELQTPPKRRMSLNPKQIFSNTVLLARRFSLRGASNRPEKDGSQRPLGGPSHNLSPVHNLTHSTALRPNKTANALQRVTSLLTEIEAQKSRHITDMPRVLSNRSTLSQRLVGGGARRHHTTRFASGAPSRRTPPVSYTSSQRDLRMGLVPTATPEHNATYKVGDQIFFKVDISIRGGTSYLPSEARRIHTPPLPGEEIHVQGPLGPDGRRLVKMKPRGESVNEVRLPKPPEMQLALTRDWYDVQLQLLESEAKPALSHDVPIDYDIPEHLPSSPLCPRNDRYWRYVQRKLKPGEDRHRVCWMHGIRDDWQSSVSV
jgi:hypothetical protein